MTLALHLERLATWLRRDGRAPPWRVVRLVESGAIKWSAISTIPRGALHSVADYETRFGALLAMGYSWINLSALGVIDGELLVCVELPRDPTGAFGHTSVNLSGPAFDLAGKPVWDASLRHRIV